MKVCVAGDVHGQLMRFYDNVASFERELGFEFDCVLQVGDLGVWPDVKKMDAASRRHGDMGAFSIWHKANHAAPRRTFFIKGNHDDGAWLDERWPDRTAVLPEMIYVPNGRSTLIGDGAGSPSIGAIGGCYSPKSYALRRDDQRPHRHYLREEIERLMINEPIDILLTHEPPEGVEVGSGRISIGLGIAELIQGKKPKICFTGHIHRSYQMQLDGVRCVGLPAIGMQKHLMAIEIDDLTHEVKISAEWPTKRGHRA